MRSIRAERLGSAAEHAGYGSALLERMVVSATRAVPFASARATGALGRASQARAAAEALAFRNGVFAVGQPAAAAGHHLLVYAAFTLHGEERREGLCAGTVSLVSLGVVRLPRAATRDDAVHLLCEGCAPRAEGRVACPVCRGRRGRGRLTPAGQVLAGEAARRPAAGAVAGGDGGEPSEDQLGRADAG